MDVIYKTWSILVMDNWILKLQPKDREKHHYDGNTKGCGCVSGTYPERYRHDVGSCVSHDSITLCELNRSQMLSPQVKTHSSLRGNQLLKLIVCERSLTSTWQTHYPCTTPVIFSYNGQQMPNVRSLDFLLTGAGDVNKSHYPPVISLIKIKPIMKEEHIRLGFLF